MLSSVGNFLYYGVEVIFDFSLTWAGHRWTANVFFFLSSREFRRSRNNKEDTRDGGGELLATRLQQAALFSGRILNFINAKESIAVFHLTIGTTVPEVQFFSKRRQRDREIEREKKEIISLQTSSSFLRSSFLFFFFPFFLFSFFFSFFSFFTCVITQNNRMEEKTRAFFFPLFSTGSIVLRFFKYYNTISKNITRINNRGSVFFFFFLLYF